MTDYLWTDTSGETDNPQDLTFHSATDGIITFKDFNLNSTKTDFLSDIRINNTLRKYLQALKYNNLKAMPTFMSNEHLDLVFDQNIYNFANMNGPIDLKQIDMLLQSLTMDWLNLPLEISDNKVYNNDVYSNAIVHFVFLPRKTGNHIFVI